MSADVEKLCALMVKYGLCHLKHGDIELRRPDAAVFADSVKDEKQPEPDLDPLEALQRMTPDQQDRVLQLGRTQ